jgi:hypothetical protein
VTDLPEDFFEYTQPQWCNRNDHYDGPGKVYPARHGLECPGHKDWNINPDPDRLPLPEVGRWWGYSEDVVKVDPRYL